MPADVASARRLSTTLGWPLGMAWTAWHYTWRILPVHRLEEPGSVPEDLPPPLSDGISREDIQLPEHGAGPLLHRVYSATILDARLDASSLMAEISRDPDQVTPRQIARFHRASGDGDHMSAGDEYLVHMPGPWNGPVRVVEVRPTSFRLATLRGHLEAGQIEWRAWHAEEGGELHFAVESWARAGDRLSALLHDRLRMAKEVQLYMWTTVVEHLPRVAGGRLGDGVHVHTRRVPADQLG